MATELTPEKMKAIVRRHFEDLVDNQRAEVIRENMAPDFLDHNGPGDREVGITEDDKMMLGMSERMPGIKVVRGFVAWRFGGDKIAERWAPVDEAPERVT